LKTNNNIKKPALWTHGVQLISYIMSTVCKCILSPSSSKSAKQSTSQIQIFKYTNKKYKYDSE